MADNAFNIGEAIGGIAIAVATYVRGKHTGKDKGADEERRLIVEELTSCKESNRKLRVRLSAMETEMVTLRKLLPGGEWYVKLGLDTHPDKER